MADVSANQALEILIKLGVIGQKDAEAVRDLMKETKGAAESTAAATKEFGKAGEEAAEKINYFNTHGREFKKLVHEVDHILPGTGLLLKAVFNPAVLGFGAMVLGIKLVTDYLEKQKKAAEEAAQAAAVAWQIQRDAALEAADAAEKFAEGLSHAKDKGAELKTQFEQEKAVLDAQIEAHKKLLDAIEKTQIAEAAGDKDKEDQIKSRFADLKREYDIQSELLKLTQERGQLDRLKFAQPKLAFAAQDAESNLEFEKNNQRVNEAKARMDGKDEIKLKQAADEARKFIAEQEDYFKNGLGRMTNPVLVPGIIAENTVKQRAAIEAFEAYERDKQTVDEHNKKLEQLNKKLTDQVKARDENQKAIDEETAKVKTAELVYGIHKTEVTIERALGDIERLGGEGQLPGLLESVGANMEILKHGGKLTDSQTQTQQVFKQLMQDLGFNGVQILQMAKALGDTQWSMALRIKQQDAEIAAIHSKIAALLHH